jgi:hypothetical protein
MPLAYPWLHRVIPLAKRYKAVIGITALLMIGAGCVGAVRETNDQLSHDMMKPLTVPIDAYKQGVDAASNTHARDLNALQQSGLPAE